MDGKIWIRLGGYVLADTIDELNDIGSGNPDALVNAIKKHGFEVNGDTYIPTASCDVEFDLGLMNLVVKGGDNV